MKKKSVESEKRRRKDKMNENMKTKNNVPYYLLLARNLVDSVSVQFLFILGLQLFVS